jgi:hypothetical protein
MPDSEFAIIAERQLVLCNDETGERRDFVVRIGQPKWNQDRTEAVCPINIAGLKAGRCDIRGIDPINALELGLLFVDKYLSNPTGNVRFTWPSGTPYEPLAWYIQRDTK